MCKEPVPPVNTLLIELMTQLNQIEDHHTVIVRFKRVKKKSDEIPDEFQGEIVLPPVQA